MEADDLKQTLPKSLVLMNLRLMFYFNVKKKKLVFIAKYTHTI